MPNNIFKTLQLNKKKFENIEGKKIYYSPQTTWFTVVFLIILIIGHSYFLTTDDTLALFWILSILLFTFFLLRMFHKAIFKNPIFIVNKNRLYYTKNEKWYDLNNCFVYEKLYSKSFYMTLVIDYNEYETPFEESFWYIKYDDELRKLLKPYYKERNN